MYYAETNDRLNMSKTTMECGLCKTEVHPLDAHMGRLNRQLPIKGNMVEQLLKGVI